MIREVIQDFAKWLQKKSYVDFLLEHANPSERPDKGLQKVFKSVFPLEDFSGSARIEYIEYDFQSPKFDVDECRQRDKTYACLLYTSPSPRD